MSKISLSYSSVEQAEVCGGCGKEIPRGKGYALRDKRGVEFVEVLHFCDITCVKSYVDNFMWEKRFIEDLLDGEVFF